MKSGSPQGLFMSYFISSFTLPPPPKEITLDKQLGMGVKGEGLCYDSLFELDSSGNGNSSLKK